MRKTLTYIFCLLLIAASAHAIVVGFSGPSASTPAGCSLLDADFDGESNGVELSTLGWTETDASTDRFITDTTTYHDASASAKIEMSSAADERLTKTFTEQTTGTFTVSFAFYSDGQDSGVQKFLNICDGDFSWFSTNALTLGWQSDGLLYHDGTTWQTIADTDNLSTWMEVEIVIDTDTDTFNLSIGGVSKVSGGALTLTGLSPDRLVLIADIDVTYDVWVDELCID